MNGDSSWLKDGVVEIERITKAAVNVTPSVIDLKHEKPGTYAVVMPAAPGGKLADALDVRVAKPLWHNEQLRTPDDLVTFIKDKAKRRGASVQQSNLDDDEEAPRDGGVVYIGEDQITYAFDFEDRRDRASVPLVTSKPWDWLVKADNDQISLMSQRDVIRTIRLTFGGALPPGSTFLSLLRNINFTNNAGAQANIQHGNHSLGKQTLNEVRGVADLPEDVAFNVQVFENFNYTVTVQCVFEIYPDTQKFEIVPYPNQLQRAMEQTLETIRSRFGEVAPAFLGKVRADA